MQNAKVMSFILEREMRKFLKRFLWLLRLNGKLIFRGASSIILRLESRSNQLLVIDEFPSSSRKITNWSMRRDDLWYRRRRSRVGFADVEVSGKAGEIRRLLVRLQFSYKRIFTARAHHQHTLRDDLKIFSVPCRAYRRRFSPQELSHTGAAVTSLQGDRSS